MSGAAASLAKRARLPVLLAAHRTGSRTNPDHLGQGVPPRLLGVTTAPFPARGQETWGLTDSCSGRGNSPGWVCGTPPPPQPAPRGTVAGEES